MKNHKLWIEKRYCERCGRELWLRFPWRGANNHNSYTGEETTWFRRLHCPKRIWPLGWRHTQIQEVIVLTDKGEEIKIWDHYPIKVG